MAIYHLGEEIKKEVKRQGMSMEAFADRMCIERQSVYDIFKRAHIATDRLATISSVLNRDFFKELSLLYNSTATMTEESDNDGTKWLKGLLPDEELHIMLNGEEIDSVVDEYMTADRTQPLVVFYAADTDYEVDYMLGRWERKGWKSTGDTARDIHRDIMFQDWGNHLRLEQTPHYSVLLYNDTNYFQAIGNAVELMERSGRHIVVVIPVVNALSRGNNGGLVYDDIAEGCFREWSKKAHFVVAQDKDSGYQRRREYYHAYLGDGVIDRLVKEIAKTDGFAQRLFDLVVGSSLLTVIEIMPTDNTGLSRMLLALPAPDSQERELLFANGVNNSPHLDMWIDQRDGHLVDYQYREHPLTVLTGAISTERLDRKPKPQPLPPNPVPERKLIPEVTPGTPEYDKAFKETIDALKALEPDKIYEDLFGDECETEYGLAVRDTEYFKVAVSRDKVTMSDFFITRGAVEANECLQLTVTGMEAVAKLMIFFRVDYQSGDDFPYELVDAIIEYFIEHSYNTFEEMVPLMKKLDIECNRLGS